ncbi:MAG TPA: transporter [Flavisolibacter sp.]|nr:transporter [Flavisolibacter sp.]
MRIIFLTALVGFFQPEIFAQDPERIDTDRPDQTESAVTVPKRYFQMELGFGKENLAGKNYSLTHPSFLLKYGISKRIELRLEGDFFSDYVQLISNGETTTLLSPLEIGTKIALFEEKSWRPKTSFIGHLGLPFTGSNFNRSQNIFPSFRFTFQHTLSDHVGLGYNAGAEWDGFNNQPVWVYTFAPGFNIGKRWYSYVEAFGFLTTGQKPQHNLDGGVAYYISNSTKLDVSGGIGLGSNPLRNYFAIGASFRIGPERK